MAAAVLTTDGKGKILVEDEAGKVVDFHSLRHSTATLLSQAGIAPQIAQAILRHADTTTTMTTHTHLQLLDKVGAVEALRKLGQTRAKEAAELQIAVGAEFVQAPVLTTVPPNPLP